MKKFFFFILLTLLTSSFALAQCLSDSGQAHTGHGYAGRIGKTAFFYHYWSYKTDKGYLNTLLMLSDSTIAPEYDVCLNEDHSSITYYTIHQGKRTIADTSVNIRKIPGGIEFLKLGDLNNWSLEKLATLSSMMKLYISGNHLILQFAELEASKGLILHKMIYQYQNGVFVLQKDENTVLSPNPEER